jgi:hypothetical protein
VKIHSSGLEFLHEADEQIFFASIRCVHAKMRNFFPGMHYAGNITGQVGIEYKWRKFKRQHP